MDSHHHKPDDDLEPLEEDGDLEPREGDPDEEEEQDEPLSMHVRAGEPGFFQQQMHLQNRRDIRKLQNGHSRMMNMLTRIAANTEDLPEIKKRVDDLEEGRDKVKGAMWIVGIGTPLFTWLASRVFKF